MDRWAAETSQTQINSKHSESCGLLNSRPSGSKDSTTEQHILGCFASRWEFFSAASCCSLIDVSVMWPDRWHALQRAWLLLQQLPHRQSNFYYRSWFKLKSAHLPKLFLFKLQRYRLENLSFHVGLSRNFTLNLHVCVVHRDKGRIRTVISSFIFYQ